MAKKIKDEKLPYNLEQPGGKAKFPKAPAPAPMKGMGMQLPRLPSVTRPGKRSR
jgi:hypothetical protein